MLIVTLALAAVTASGDRPGALRQALSGTEIELRLGTAGTISDDDAARAKARAGEVLASIGVVPSWVDCANSIPCAGTGRRSIRVQLLPVDSRIESGLCGVVARDAVTGAPTVLVYVPAVRRLALAAARGQGAQRYPVLAGLQVGDVLGMTIAHEAGHALGLPHVNRGVMKARPGLGELAALRHGKLGFE